jgi:hypothetical protein
MLQAEQPEIGCHELRDVAEMDFVAGENCD